MTIMTSDGRVYEDELDYLTHQYIRRKGVAPADDPWMQEFKHRPVDPDRMPPEDMDEILRREFRERPEIRRIHTAGLTTTGSRGGPSTTEQQRLRQEDIRDIHPNPTIPQDYPTSQQGITIAEKAEELSDVSPDLPIAGQQYATAKAEPDMETFNVLIPFLRQIAPRGIDVEGMRPSTNVEDRTLQSNKILEEFNIAVAKEDTKTIGKLAEKYGYAFIYNTLANRIMTYRDEANIPKSVANYVRNILSPKYKQGGLGGTYKDTPEIEQWLKTSTKPTGELSAEAGYFDLDKRAVQRGKGKK